MTDVYFSWNTHEQVICKKKISTLFGILQATNRTLSHEIPLHWVELAHFWVYKDP